MNILIINQPLNNRGDESAHKGLVRAIVKNIPEAEITSYAIDLKAMTQGSGHFTRKFIRYADVPENLVKKIIEEYKPKQA